LNALRVRELTARGRGGVAVLEVSGSGALERVRALCPGSRPSVGSLSVVRLRAADTELDEALAVVLAEDLVELHLHGSPPLVHAVREQLGEQSGPGVGPTLEERAAARAAEACSEVAARILLDQAEGALRRELEAVASASRAEQNRRLDTLLAGARVLQYAATPSLVLLLGPANAGKSTLFNALMGSDRVLVSAQHGTTRDVVVDRARLGAYPVDLADGPGERDRTRPGAGPVAELEREGARLARGLIGGVELVLWLSPAGRPSPPPAELPPGATVVLTSQVDLMPATALAAGATGVSGLTQPSAAVATVERLFLERLDLPAQPWTPGAAALFEPAQVLYARRARAARAEERQQLLAGLLEPWDDVPIQGS